MIKFIPMYYEYRRAFASLSDEQFGRVIRAMFIYAGTKMIISLDPDEVQAFNKIREDCDKFWAKHRSK